MNNTALFQQRMLLDFTTLQGTLKSESVMPNMQTLSKQETHWSYFGSFSLIYAE